MLCYSFSNGSISSFSKLSSLKLDGGVLLQLCSCPFARSENINPPNEAMPADIKKTFCHCPLVGYEQREINLYKGHMSVASFEILVPLKFRL